MLLQAFVPNYPAYARFVVARVLLMSSACQQQTNGISGTYLCCTVEGGVAPDTVVLPDISTCIRHATYKDSKHLCQLDVILLLIS